VQDSSPLDRSLHRLQRDSMPGNRAASWHRSALDTECKGCRSPSALRPGKLKTRAHHVRIRSTVERCCKFKNIARTTQLPSIVPLLVRRIRKSRSAASFNVYNTFGQHDHVRSQDTFVLAQFTWHPRLGDPPRRGTVLTAAVDTMSFASTLPSILHKPPEETRAGLDSALA